MAADFGHAHTFGRAYYVATRFFDRQHRTLQPGFLLAYAEAECLRRAGFALWDLGGADRSPMMQYKPQVALEMHRSEFLLRLSELACAEGWGEGGRAMTDLEAAPPPGGERVPLGVVFQARGALLGGCLAGPGRGGPLGGHGAAVAGRSEGRQGGAQGAGEEGREEGEAAARGEEGAYR